MNPFQSDSGATPKEDGQLPAKNHSKVSGRKPPKKSDAAATAAAELEKEIQKNERCGVDGGDAEAEDGDDKPAANKDQKSMLVDHTYTNYALLSDKELVMLDEHSSMLPEPKSEEEKLVREKLLGMSCTYGPMKKSSGGVVQPFPGKLMDVLDRSDLVDIISWMPHGRAFIVKKPKLFAVDVLPRFFKQTKYLSFTRQLNLWGFKRITKGLDGGAYYHELFLRGRPYLAMRMKRHKVKGTGIKLTPNPSAEPLFYRDYPYMEQLDETRSIAPLPPLPPGRVVLPDKKTSSDQNAPAAAGSGVPTLPPGNHQSAHQPPLQMGQFPGFAPSAMMGLTHPYLTGSNGQMGSPFSRQSPFSGASYGGLSRMSSGMHGGGLGGGLGGASAAFPSMNPARNYDNVLFAPGVSWGSVAASGHRVNDPIQDELTAMIRNRQSEGVSATDMYSSQNYNSDRLLIERLRDVDRTAQLKREQQAISMLEMGGGIGERPAYAAPGAPTNPNFASFTGPSTSNGLGNGPLDRYRQMMPLQSGAIGFGNAYDKGFGNAYEGAFASIAAGKGASTQNIDDDQPTVESSVKEALREANHLEELALAQRAKARNIALAGALQLTSRTSGAAPSQGFLSAGPAEDSGKEKGSTGEAKDDGGKNVSEV